MILSIYLPCAQIISRHVKFSENEMRYFKWSNYVFIALSSFLRNAFSDLWFNFQIYEWIVITFILHLEQKLDFDKIKDKINPSKIAKFKFNRSEKKLNTAFYFFNFVFVVLFLLFRAYEAFLITKDSDTQILDFSKNGYFNQIFNFGQNYKL